jgi:hypothetical protein
MLCKEKINGKTKKYHQRGGKHLGGTQEKKHQKESHIIGKAGQASPQDPG